MAYTADSKSAAERRVGSSPTSAIQIVDQGIFVPLPSAVVQSLGWDEGTHLDISVIDGRIVVQENGTA